MNVKTRTLFLFAAALPLLAAREASASTYCTPGALNACASVTVQKNGDVVVIRVTNLQGYDPADNVWYSGIWGFDLFAPGITGVDATSLTSSFGGGAYADAGQPAWTLLSANGWIRLWAPGGGGYITGCEYATAQIGAQAGKYHTCGAGDWIEFTFSTYGNWDLSQANLAWGTHVMQTKNSPLQSLMCDSRTGASCATFETTLVVNPVQGPTGPTGPTVPGNVTPEPVTLALLGTGLAGVGAAARRRRKEQQGGDDV